MIASRSSALGTRDRAFSLIELLVGIAIIGILAVLLFPALGGLKAKANQAEGTASLRKVGGAIAMYASEHDNALPGPAPLGIYPDYDKASAGNARALGALLAPYLGLPDASTLQGGKKIVIPELACPGFRAVKGDNTLAPNYVQNAVLSERPDAVGSTRVFGSLSSTSADPRAPLRMHSLAQYGGPSKVWALTNLDQQQPRTVTLNSGWVPIIPAEPVYKNVRLRLYLDGHVKTVPIDAPLR